MKKSLFILLSFFVFSFKDKDKSKEQKILDRIEFVYNLKQTVDQSTWPTFNDQEYDLPLIYFTDTGSYIANPTDKFLASFTSDLVFQNSQIRIYKTKNRIDSLPFHMETEITLGDPTDEYNYHAPFMKCSSYEEVHKAIPKVHSTEQWVTMLMHEYFHGYQYKHKAFVAYYEKEIALIGEDSLKSIYKNNSWFKQSIDEENRLLLKAINENDRISRKKTIAHFFSLRKKRRKEVLAKLKLDISKYEQCYETTEGTARYIEYSLYTLFSTRKPDYKLLQSDPSFKSFDQFRNYNIQNDEWLYLTEKTAYFYATGFNLVRLLDQLKIEYKSKLFKQGATTLEDLLAKSFRN